MGGIGRGKGDAVLDKGGKLYGPRMVGPPQYVGAVALPAPPPRPGSSSIQTDSNPDRVLTKAVRTQIEF